MPVATFTALTVTPGITDPVLSVTVPRIVPRSLWAIANVVKRMEKTAMQSVFFRMLAMMAS
jgi:hypothetical protein